MKRTLLLLLCTATLGLVSCKKDTIIQETPNRTFVYTVQPSQWERTNSDTFTAELSVPEIDQISIDDEGLLVYISHPINSSSYIQLPYVFNRDAYSYEMFDGGIAIDIQSSDEQANQPFAPTSPVQVKIVLIPSEFIP